MRLIALAGVLSISFSAVFIRLAQVSPVTATFFRAAYAVPVLAAVWLVRRRDGRRTRGEHLLAFLSGVLLAADLSLWHESIAMIGVGLGTLIANVQVVFVTLAAWFLYRERPTLRTVAFIGLVLVGVALTSGLSQPEAYGADPVSGVLFGVGAGLCYAGFLMVFRASNRRLVPTAGPLLEATIGTAAGALAAAVLDPRFTLTPGLTASLWLASLALVAQVVGWLFIATALPRLPAAETSVILLVQPVCAIVWGVVFFAERLSAFQWLGSAVVLLGVARLLDRPLIRGT